MRRAAAILALAALPALAGCPSTPIGSATATRADDAPRVDDPRYLAALERYTETTSIYDGLDQRVFAAATWQALPFRVAKVAAIAEFLHLPAGDAAALLESERLEAARYEEFFVGFYTSERRWNDLGADGSIWRVELEAAGGPTVLPLEIERYERPDANLTALYPYLTPFWIGYRVRFPALDVAGAPLLPPGTPRILRLASAVGLLQLDFVPGPVAAAP